METIFHSHHAVISPRMRRRAEIAAERAAARLPRAVDAIIRFEQDGPVKRVEIVLHAPRHAEIVASGEARYYGPALTIAIERLGSQIRKLSSSRRSAQRAPQAEKAYRA